MVYVVIGLERGGKIRKSKKKNEINKVRVRNVSDLIE